MQDKAGRPSTTGLWVGYLPLVVVSALVVAMVVVVPSEVPQGGFAASSGPARQGIEGQTATGWGEGVAACADREKQVEGDGYSPPCFEFSGDNGGETSPGVTADTIRVNYRVTADPHLLVLLSQAAGIPIDETPDDLVRTMEGLVDHFNQSFQFYGRQLEMVRTEGQGGLLAEFTGGGQENARQDALRAKESEVFADITGNTQPYAEALTRQEIVNIGAPYMSAEWFEAQRPYAWSHLPDCTVTAVTSVSYGVNLVYGKPAVFAGGDLANQERRIGLITPNNREYMQCGDAAEKTIEEAGYGFAKRENYVLDAAQLQTQAISLLGEMRRAGVTSIACGCDPLTILYLAQQAEQQQYYPEWLVIGVAFGDLDLVGQIIQSASGSQWSRAFGGSPWGAQPTREESPGYRAYKSVREDEPSLLVDLLYVQLYELVIGIQMAGPELTPENFETGMFAYPTGEGVAGTWNFNRGQYTGAQSAREIWWDPEASSPFNGEPGAYRSNDVRWTPAEPPSQIGAFG